MKSLFESPLVEWKKDIIREHLVRDPEVPLTLCSECLKIVPTKHWFETECPHEY